MHRGLRATNVPETFSPSRDASILSSRFEIGKRLEALAAGIAGARATSVLQEIPMAAAVMARLHAMNLATWKADPFMLETHGLRALEDLEGELKAIAARSDFPGGRCVMAQVCIERI